MNYRRRGHWVTRRGTTFWRRTHTVHSSAKKKSTIGVTIVLAGGITTATITIPGSSGGAGSSGTTQVRGNPPDAGQPTVNVSLSDFKRTENVLMAAGYKNFDYAGEYGAGCASHSYGAVKGFFKAHPCNWVTRAYLAVHEGNLGEVLVAISWVAMPNASLGNRYKSLVDAKGTGNITEFSRDNGPYKTIKYDGLYYESGRVGSMVWNVQVQPVGAIPTAVVSGILGSSKQS
jgi:hypothetical protein